MNMETKTASADQKPAEPRSRQQQEIEEALQKLRILRRKSVHTYLGLWGLAYDRIVTGVINVAQQGIEFSQSAEARGAEVEQALRTQVSGLERQAINGVVWLRERIDEHLQPSNPMSAAHATPTIIAIKTTDEPPSLSTAPSGGALLDPVAAKPRFTHLPLANYDQLMAKQIIDQLGRLTVDELRAVQEYEQQSAARITILRAIEQTLRRKLAIT